MKWKEDKNGVLFTKHSNFRIEQTPHHTFGEMVTIQKGPSYASHLLGKRYINIQKAIGAICIVTGEKLIGKGLNEAVAEMADLGLLSPAEISGHAGGIVEPHYPLNPHNAAI